MASEHEKEPGEAECWFARLKAADCTPEERAAFEQWREERANANAFEELELLYGASAALKFDPGIRNAIRAARQHPHRSFRGWRRALVPAAVAAAIALVVPFMLPKLFTGSSRPMPELRYATMPGERLSVVLADGTALLLDTDSVVSVHMTSAARGIVLEQGQAQFQVVHDVARPFTVGVGSASIQDVGTTFIVRKNEENVVVTVLEGSVGVSAPPHQAELFPSQQLTFDASGALWKQTVVNVNSATSWTTGELVFEDASLADVVREMNRYSRTPIQIGEPSLDRLRVSGVFHAGDQRSFVLALEKGWGLTATDAPSAILLRSRTLPSH